MAVKPHQVLHGDEVVTVYIPPQFDLTSPLNNPSEDIHTDLPASAGDIMITMNPDEDPNYPGLAGLCSDLERRNCLWWSERGQVKRQIQGEAICT